MEAGSGAQNLPKQWPVPYVDYKYISLTPYDSTFFYAAHIIIIFIVNPLETTTNNIGTIAMVQSTGTNNIGRD